MTANKKEVGTWVVEVQRTDTLGQPSSDWQCVSQCEEGQTALAVVDALQNFMHISHIEGGFQTRTRMIEEGGTPDGI